MADRTYLPPMGSLDAGVVKLWPKWTVGAAGAVSSFSGNGIFAITKTAAAGTYVISMASPVPDVYFGGIMAALPTRIFNGDTVAYDMVVLVDATNTSTPLTTPPTPSFTVQFQLGGVATNLASGTVVTVETTLKNSTV